MKSLTDLTTGAIAGTIGIFGSQMRGVGPIVRSLSAVGMAGFATSVLYAHPHFKVTDQNHYALIVGTLIPMAIDAALQYGLDVEDYITNPVILAVTFTISVVAMETNKTSPSDRYFNVDLQRLVRPLLHWNLDRQSPDYGTVQPANEIYQL